MNKIDTTQIVDPTSQQPFTGKSLKFLQDSTYDMLNALARGLVGGTYNTSLIYVLNGLTKNGSNVIANGYVFYFGEIFYVIGANVSAYVNVPVLIPYTPIDATYDPVLFSDGVNKNVHNVRQLQIADQLSGTGLADYSNLSLIANKFESLHYTPVGFNVAGMSSAAMGVVWTAPSYQYNVEIYIEADVAVAWITNGRIQATFGIKNLTTLGFYPTFCQVIDLTDTSTGKTRGHRMVGTWRKTGIAANTNLEPWVGQAAADQMGVGNIYIRITQF